MKKVVPILLILALAFSAALAQWHHRGNNPGGGDTGYVYTEEGVRVNADTVRTARETASHSTGTPEWTNTPGFEKDVFTFARIIYRRAPDWSGISVTSSG